ncbi:MAG: hypothetical protein V3V99_13470 [candidate division Zixibacteria bacterium]
MRDILFCNWDSDASEFSQSDLFDITDLSNYNVVFFDPMNFAIRNGYRKNTADLRRAEYIDRSEREFLQFLAKTKMASRLIHNFLFAGGLLVIRSNFPISYIRVKKMSSAGVATNQYTESILSIFFWLEDFLGKYSCQYGPIHAMRFKSPNSHLYSLLGRTAVETMMSINFSEKENLSIIAEATAYPHHPVIQKISQSFGPGEVYIIPKFLSSDENSLLAKSFSGILHHRRHDQKRPKWIEKFEQKIERVNPYNLKIVDLQEEIKVIERAIKNNQELSLMAEGYVDLLYTTGSDLKGAVVNAMQTLGFQFPQIPETISGADFDVYMRDKTAVNIAVEIISEKLDPVTLDLFNKVINKINKCHHDYKPRCIIVANAPCEMTPESRNSAFTEEVISANLKQRCCLISSVDLFSIMVNVLENQFSPRIDAVKEFIREDIVRANGPFKSNIRKYLKATTV